MPRITSASKRRRTAIALITGAAVTVLLTWLAWTNRHLFTVLQPKGTIAHDERNLMIFATVLSLIVVVPVFALIFGIAWRYRDTNPRPATYQPNWEHSRRLETIWWGIPCAIILVLAVVTWTSTHALDPFKPVASNGAVQPLNVQVVALQWRWLFIYPDQGIATVNELHVPVGTPLNFHITSDAPMNSFWIPQLGGQIYAMSGMETMLHLRADAAGTYDGSSANLSGSGFADMRFKVIAEPPQDFDRWIDDTRRSPYQLTEAGYKQLSKPSHDRQPIFYATSAVGLYDTIMARSMDNTHDMHNTKETGY